MRFPASVAAAAAAAGVASALDPAPVALQASDWFVASLADAYRAGLPCYWFN